MASLVAAAGWAQDASDPLDLDHPAIGYRTTATSDRVARLNSRLQAREVQLEFSDRGGYLPSLLQALDIPVESQMAVYSKTSLQSGLIRPSNPRTVFFNDSVAVAWMRGGFIEVTAQDPAQGPIFYLLPQAAAATPQLSRDERCLACHFATAAGGVPGLLVRSLPTAADGATLPWLGNYITDHRSPLEERWGGWYVTGTHGSRPHLGNLQIADRRAQELPRWSSDRTLKTLSGLFETDSYLSPYSDIVALLVFDHQARMMNLLTRLGWQTRIAAFERRAPASDPALRATANELVDYMLFVDEAPLDRISGTSGYAQRFSAMGPRDGKGRSLRDLDLQKRLLRYPCSYMVYSAAFDGLPADARELVYRRMKDVLSGQEGAAKYRRLTSADRQAILEILRETKPGLPAWF
jgi:hypothetical protein